MSERLRLPAGVRRHIRKELKPEARIADTEDKAWEATEQIVTSRVEDYPEKYRPSLGAIREYHKLRFEARQLTLSKESMAARLRDFERKFPSETIDGASEVFRVITQIYSKPR